MQKILLITLFVISFSTSSQAANEAGTYTFLSEGTASCGKYLEAITKAERGESKVQAGYFYAYLDGYFTGVNRYLPDTRNIMGNTDIQGVRAYIKKFCSENPLKDYIDAISSVQEELYPNRAK